MVSKKYSLAKSIRRNFPNHLIQFCALRSLLTMVILTLALSFFSCSSSSSTPESPTSPLVDPAGDVPPVSDEPIPDVKTCSSEQLSIFEQNVKTALTNLNTGNDFAVLIRHEDGREIKFEKGFMTVDTRIDSASTAKWVTGSVVLEYLQSDLNRLSLKPLTLDSYVHEFLLTGEWGIPEGDSLRAIKLRHLLSFTSGLINEPKCIKLGLPVGITFSECVREVAKENIGNSKVPGEGFYYSGTHLHVAGLMVIRARNLALAVSNSDWHMIFEEFKARTKTFGSAVYDLPTLANPRLAGGISWTASEFSGFLDAFIRRKVFADRDIPGALGVNLHDLQVQDQRSAAVTEYSPAQARTGLDWHYGFGLWLECQFPQYTDCVSSDQVSSAGAYGSYPVIHLKRRYSAILAQMGALGTGFEGYEAIKSIDEEVRIWAEKKCD